jgi:small subunit ribosomal protein S6
LAREYELVLMLDPEAPDERRAEIADGARKRIESAGELKHADSWGMRKMAYEIRQRTEADYRIFRFATDGPLLNDLDHTLKITDGVLRFRIFKVDPGAPMITPPAGTLGGRGGRGEGRGERRGRPDRGAPAAEESTEEAPPSEPAPETPAEPTAEEPAEHAPEAPAEAPAEPASEGGEADQPASEPESGEQPSQN